MDRAIRLLRRPSRPSPAPRTRGQMMVLFALAFTAMAAGVGMAADMAMWMVERQHLQTAVDSAAIAGARRLVAYAGDPGAVAQASAEAQNYLTQYGYPASAFTGSGQSLTMSSPGPRQFRIVATRSRPTLLVKLVGVSQLSTSASSTATASIKADIYAANDVTASMSATDMTNLKNALNDFIDMLGLDPADPEGPRIAIGRFIGERCRRASAYDTASAGWDTSRGSPTQSSKWYYYNNWLNTGDVWCDPNAPPPFYSGGTFSIPGINSSLAPPNPLPASPNPCKGSPSPDPGWWSPYYPGACTLTLLTADANAAHSAVNNLQTGTRQSFSTNCTSSPGPSTGSGGFARRPYRAINSSQDCDAAGTSHMAGLATAARELNSSRTRYAQGQLTFRRVLILETDGVVCTISTPFSPTQAQNRAITFANQMKTTPDAFQGIEIFVVMFWDDDGTQTCGNNQTDDSLGSLYPNCPNATSLAAAGPRTPTDDYLISLSSSKLNTCDHYFPFNKANGSQLHTVYREILKRLAVGKLMG